MAAPRLTPPRLPGPIRELADALTHPRPPRPEGHRVWRMDSGRLHIALRRAAEPAAQALAAQVESALSDLPGVRWATLNAGLGVVIVAVDEDTPPTVESLVSVVDAVERRDGEEERHPKLAVPHPSDPASIVQSVTELAGDALALGLSTAGRTLHWLRFPAELPAAITFLDSQPRLHEALRRLTPNGVGETALDITVDVAQGLAQGGLGLGVDAFAYTLQLWDAVERRGAWRRFEKTVPDDPGAAACAPIVVERPRPLADGPVEKYVSASQWAAVGAGAATLIGARDPRRALAVGLTMAPKSARLGRHAYATTLGIIAAHRGAVVLEPDALNRLDRLDTVVVDTDALGPRGHVLGSVRAEHGEDGAALMLAAHSLFRADEPEAEVHRDGWTLRPHEEGLLSLHRGERLVATVPVHVTVPPIAHALVHAARDGGLDIRFAIGERAWSPDALSDVRSVPGGHRLLASIRELQADGHGVLLVSGRSAALGNADVGIGVTDSGRPAWGAHVLAGDLETAAFLTQAASSAAAVSKRSVNLAKAGSALGASLALSAHGPTSARRGLTSVNAAAAVSAALGAWTAVDLTRHPVAVAPEEVPWHAMPTAAVLRELGATEAGLSSRAAAARRRRTQETPPHPSLGRAFMEELANPLTPMLTGAAAIAAAVGSTVDATLVAGVNLGSALFGGVERVRTDRALSRLFDRSATTSTVVRDGREEIRPAEALVPGDVVLLTPGDVVAADCRLLSADSLEMDESSLTGESMPVAKSADPSAARDIAERTSMVYEGTTVSSGQARAVVVAVGSGTEVGRSLAAAHRAAPRSGVDVRLGAIMNRTAPIALGSALAVVGAGLIRGRELQEVVTSAVGLAVAAVPEGLPFIASAAQLAAARRLSEHGILVRNPRTIEALGRVDVLCFDKTGTLTEGRVTLAHVSDGQRRVPLTALTPTHRAVLAAALRATPEPGNGKFLHATDRAVADGASEQGIDRGAQGSAWHRLDELPFDSSRGFHAVLGEVAGQHLLSVKGAPEVVLPRCVVDRSSARLLRGELHRLTSAGYRVLAVAERRTDASALDDDQVSGLTLLGFLALADPVRRTAGASLAELRDAGIQLLMITGDHPATARTIAEELELLNGGRVLTGAEIDALDDEGLDRVLPEVTVVARGTPAHKVRIVETFQRLGRTVAMTGDGSNDAPAIRLADVGIALGQRGTAAARAAADLVVTDDRLDTILLALVEGRAMWASVREGLGILVGGNLGEIAFTVLGALISSRSPLTARQLLLVNLLTDLAPALAVAVRPPQPDAYTALAAEGPDRSLGASLERDMAFRAATTAAGASAAWLIARATGTPTRARTVALTALVATQLGQTLVIGGRNRTVALACLGSGVLLAGVVQTPGVSQLFDCRPMGPVAWTIALGSAAGATVLATAAQPWVYRLLDVERYRSPLRPPPQPASR